MAANVFMVIIPNQRKITAALEDLKTPVKGVIATWNHPYSKWDPANVETHEAFRRQQVVMGKVQDGRVVFNMGLEASFANGTPTAGHAPSLPERRDTVFSPRAAARKRSRRASGWGWVSWM